MDTNTGPQYIRIALGIASQIASGELQEGEKLSGRSLISSEYGVSPETVRKAMRQLADMKVVEVKDKSGVVVLSSDNARRFIESCAEKDDLQELYDTLYNLHTECNRLSKKMLDTYANILEAQANPTVSDLKLPHYQVKVPEDWEHNGKSLATLHFWQETEATVIAVRRHKNTIVSPGPYAELYKGDLIVFVGPPHSVSAVRRFLNVDDSIEE